ncbi:HAD family hydrolase [Synechococcus elongatus]|uniref:HAD family hydrolase n=1 Tax=Synechococcus elongatus TaxID=32046 RepID=UPI000F7D99E4|nr:HAD family phosphatase [Synechococcus elongatus]
MQTSPFQLVIFDCDGVLVDSERITNRVFADMLNELGLLVTLDDMFEQFVGHSMADCLKLIERRLGNPPPPDFVQHYQRRTRIALETHLQAVPGVEEALDALELPYCVASSGDHQKMRTTLSLTKLWPRFEGRIFSVTEVPRGKPFPDVFLLAADRFGVNPTACAVIEDTPLGVAAGVAAGMQVFGYAGSMPAWRLQEAGAHLIFDDMRLLPSLLQSSPEDNSTALPNP